MFFYSIKEYHPFNTDKAYYPLKVNDNEKNLDEWMKNSNTKSAHFDFPGVSKSNLKVEYSHKENTLYIKKRSDKDKPFSTVKTVYRVYKEPSSVKYQDGRLYIHFESETEEKKTVELNIK